MFFFSNVLSFPVSWNSLSLPLYFYFTFGCFFHWNDLESLDAAYVTSAITSFSVSNNITQESPSSALSSGFHFSLSLSVLNKEILSSMPCLIFAYFTQYSWPRLLVLPIIKNKYEKATFSFPMKRMLIVTINELIKIIHYFLFLLF